MTKFESVEESVEVAAPSSVVFDQWTRVKDFPRFMEGIAEVRRTGERKLRWRGEFAGEMREWESNITVWIPGRRIAWRATSAGAHSSRAVCVESVGPDRTRLTLKMLVDPDEAWAHLPTVEEIAQRLHGNLARFKTFLEAKLREPTAETRIKSGS
jgi:uncharacterized membrane protein